MSDASAGRLPTTGRLAAIDYGTVRLGVAVTDPEQRFASPLENYTRRGEPLDAQWLSRLAGDERLAGIVVGLPIHTNGLESQKSTEARRFGTWVQQVTGLPVCFFDERYTSAHAEELLMAAEFTKKRRKERLDMLAAQILLTAYLESTAKGQAGALPLDDALNS